jgi:hypothetical protein
LDGLKLALGLPYGNSTTTHKIHRHASAALAYNIPATNKHRIAHATSHKSLVAEIFQKPLVQATPRMVMADVGTQFDAFTPVAAPQPPAPPEPPSAAQVPSAVVPALAALSSSLDAHGTMKSLITLAEADAGRSAKLASRAAAAASAAEWAHVSAEVQISLKGQVVVTQSQYEDLEHEFDQALARLEVSQGLAARLNEVDPSFFVIRADGKKFCGTAEAGQACTLLGPDEVARIRLDVAAQVKLATIELRQVQAKLTRARLTDG